MASLLFEMWSIIDKLSFELKNVSITSFYSTRGKLLAFLRLFLLVLMWCKWLRSRICVKNLPRYVVEDRLKDFFTRKGEITDAKIMQTN